MQLDHSEGQVFGLRVSAGPAQLDLVRLASGKTALFEGLEQDLNGAFPEGAATVRNFESPNDAGVGLPHAQADVRGAVQQIAQSGSMTSEASAILQLLLDQNEALQERVVSLEKSRSGSAISAHTALEGTGDAVNAADSSRPGGSALVQSVLGPQVPTGGQLARLREGHIPGLVSPTAGVLFSGSSQLVANDKPQFGTSRVGGISNGSIPFVNES